MPGPNMKSDTNIKLPLSFIIFALHCLRCVANHLFFNSSELLSWNVSDSENLDVSSLPIIRICSHDSNGCDVSIDSSCLFNIHLESKIGFIQFLITAIGITSLLILGFRTNIAVHGGALVVIGILIFIFQMAKTIV